MEYTKLKKRTQYPVPDHTKVWCPGQEGKTTKDGKLLVANISLLLLGSLL